MTKFCPWAKWGEINPLGGGFCRWVGSRSDLRDAADNFFLHHVDDLISVQGKSSVTGSRAIMFQSQANVADDGPVLSQHWVFAMGSRNCLNAALDY